MQFVNMPPSNVKIACINGIKQPNRVLYLIRTELEQIFSTAKLFEGIVKFAWEIWECVDYSRRTKVEFVAYLFRIVLGQSTITTKLFKSIFQLFGWIWKYMQNINTLHAG